MLTRHLVLTVFSFCWCGFALAGGASEKVCSRDEAIQAEKEAAYLRDWPSVYRSYQRFGHCDDGAIAEGYSESVIRLFADQWEKVAELDRLASLDGNFEKFVLHHVDEAVAIADAQIILENARKSCPKEVRRLCRLIEEAVR